MMRMDAPPASRAANRQALTRRWMSRGLCYFILLSIALVSFFPFYVMLLGATQDNYHITSTVTLLPGRHLAGNYARMMQNKNIWRGFMNSLSLALANTAVCLYFSSLTAYAFAKFRFKGSGALYGIIVSTMMIPGQLGVIGFFRQMSDMKLLNSYIPLILPAISNCFAVFFFRQYLESSLPNELIEASLMDGCPEITIFHRVVLPVMVPALVTQGVMSFIGNWNSYLNPLIILTQTQKMTLPVMLASIKSSGGAADYGAQYVGILVSVLPLLIVFAFANRVIVEKIAIGAAVKG
ncbi:MAG: carbohydrate ABC transporter permease [Oscillospiraceae bacterium]|nr:carbohydrate ABC transporter permease [Oscillospiraceae bacterium]